MASSSDAKLTLLNRWRRATFTQLDHIRVFTFILDRATLYVIDLSINKFQLELGKRYNFWLILQILLALHRMRAEIEYKSASFRASYFQWSNVQFVVKKYVKRKKPARDSVGIRSSSVTIIDTISSSYWSTKRTQDGALRNLIDLPKFLKEKCSQQSQSCFVIRSPGTIELVEIQLKQCIALLGRTFIEYESGKLLKISSS